MQRHELSKEIYTLEAMHTGDGPQKTARIWKG